MGNRAQTGYVPCFKSHKKYLDAQSQNRPPEEEPNTLQKGTIIPGVNMHGGKGNIHTSQGLLNTGSEWLFIPGDKNVSVVH